MASKKSLNLLFFLALFFLFLLPPNDPDLGWQIRCGQEFWQEQSFCSQNRFSVLLPNFVFTNHRWLFQTLIAPVFTVSGLWGLTILNALLMALTFFFLYRSFSNQGPGLLATLFIVFLSWTVLALGLRSQEIGLLFASFLLFLSTRNKPKTIVFCFYPLLVLLWANLHGGSVIIGLLFVSFILVPLIFSSLPRIKKVFFYSLILIVSGLASLVNPFGLKIYQDAWQHFSGVNLDQLIAEWVPPTPFYWWLILLSSVGLLIGFCLSSKKIKSLSIVFCLLPLAYLAMSARRHLPFYFFLWFCLFFNHPFIRQRFLYLFEKTFLNGFSFSVTLLLLGFGLFIRLPLTVHTLSSWPNYCQDSAVGYPYRAVAFLKSQPEKGPIFNRYEWGGFLIWQLPEYKIFVDGRMPAWLARRSFGEGGPVSPYIFYLETLQSQPGWQETLKNYKIQWILVSPGTFMDLLLQPDPVKFGWHEAYRDEISVVYKKL